MFFSKRIPTHRAFGLLAGAALCAYLPSTARALTLDFAGTPNDIAFVGESVQSDGYDFENTGSNPAASGLLIDDDFGVAGNQNVAAVNGGAMLLTLIGGGAFTLTGFDLGGGIPGNDSAWAASLSLTAMLDGGGTATASVALPAAGAGYTTAPLSFGPVTSIEFTPVMGGGLDFSIDNLVFDMGGPPPDPDPDPEDVPLPASLPMLVGALGLLSFLRRRRAA